VLQLSALTIGEVAIRVMTVHWLLLACSGVLLSAGHGCPFKFFSTVKYEKASCKC
jgi:hypothetical protein